MDLENKNLRTLGSYISFISCKWGSITFVALLTGLYTKSKEQLPISRAFKFSK